MRMYLVIGERYHIDLSNVCIGLLIFNVGLGVGLSWMRSIKQSEVNPESVAGILVVATNHGGAVMLGLAWIYVRLRAVHIASYYLQQPIASVDSISEFQFRTAWDVGSTDFNELTDAA